MPNNANVRYITKKDYLTYSFFEEASTGYLWKLASDNDFKVNDIKVESLDPQNPAQGKLKKTFIVAPVADGEFEIRFIKVRPWEKNTPPLEEYKELVRVS